MLDSGITDSKGCRTPAEFALTTKPILTEILFGDMFKWLIVKTLQAQNGTCIGFNASFCITG